MKVRLRYHQTTKTLEIPQEIEDSCTVSQVLPDVLSLFDLDCDSSQTFFLSLNKKDPVGVNTDKLRDCGVVSGDILHLVNHEDDSTPTKKQNTGKERNLSTQCVNTCTQQGTDRKQTFDKNRSGNPCPDSNTQNLPCDTVNKDVIPSTSYGDPDNSVSSGADKNMHEDGIRINDMEDLDTGEPVDNAVVNQCLSEPILCCESTNSRIPAALKEMLSAMKPENETEAVCVVVHVLMLETGFIKVPDVSEKSGVSIAPNNWRLPGHYKFMYTYTGCGETQCLLTLIPTGLTLTIHGKVVGQDEVTRAISLKELDFVDHFASGDEHCFKNISKLSRIFKDAVAIPMVQDIRNAAGLEEVYGILALTQEIKLRIMSFLDVRDLLKLSSVCKEFYNISQDSYLWRQLYLKDFGNRRDNFLSQNWKQFYKQEFKIRKERRKMMSRFTMVTPPTWGPQNPFSGPSNWIPPGPGMIGGDYDLYPSFPGNLPGIPGRLGPRAPTLPRPRYDLIGPSPDLDPSPDPLLPPPRPSFGRPGGGTRNPFSGFGPRFF